MPPRFSITRLVNIFVSALVASLHRTARHTYSDWKMLQGNCIVKCGLSCRS